MILVGVAQSVEHWVVAPVVEGSSPFTHPIEIQKGCLKGHPFYVVSPPGWPEILKRDLLALGSKTLEDLSLFIKL